MAESSNCPDEAIALITSLRELMDERDRSYSDRFTSSERNVLTAMAAAEKAVEKQEIANDKRFAGVNEIRQTLVDQATTFARSDVVSTQVANLEKRLTELTSSVTAFQAAATARSTAFSQGYGWIVAGIGALGAMIGAVATFLFKH